MLVERAFVSEGLLEGHEVNAWPFTVPCVSQLVKEDMSFSAPVTFLVGENGSGKSTLVEAIAEAFGLDAYGGRAGRKYGNDRSKTTLGEIMRLDYTAAGSRMQTGPRSKKKGFFLRAETAFGLLATVSGMPGYWEDDVAEQSHGEGFLTVFASVFRERDLFVLDEPEGALSFSSCLQLVALMHEWSKSGAQVICSTHSPILASLPGAEIIEIGDHGFHTTTWEDLDLVGHWHRYLNDPNSYLRHLINDDDT